MGVSLTLKSHSEPWGRVFPNIYIYLGCFFHSAARCDITNLQFLSEHRQTLESVRIERPIFPAEQWQSLQSELFAVEFKSPDCRIDMTTQDFYFRSKYAEKHWFDGLDDDDEWIDANNWH